MLVGWNNPLTSDPAMALEPHTPNGAGERLWRMVNDECTISRDEYSRSIDFRNVLGHSDLLEEMKGRTVVVLGTAAWQALGLKRQEMYTSLGNWHLVPHPSGRNLMYNVKLNKIRTGRLIARLAGFL